MAEVLEQLGRATAKVHCVFDVDDDSPLVEFQVENAICAAVSDRVDEFVADLTGFSVSYAALPGPCVRTSSPMTTAPWVLV